MHSAAPFFRPPLKQQRYSLEIVPGRPVYVQAIPLVGDYSFKSPDDAKFNLSERVGFRNEDTLEWGLSGFDNDASSFELSIPEDMSLGERYLYAKPKKAKQLEQAKPLEQGEQPEKAKQHLLNLDEHLDLIEQYDPDSGELKAKLSTRPKNSARSIILCFDGTSNHFSNRNTNVVKLVELLKKDDPEQQLVYYQPGVGTYTSPNFFTDIGKSVATTVDQGMAWYLYQHVIDGYRYLMETYRAGDQISIFGFSRGAYTARALAGMLHSVKQVQFAFKVYETSLEVDGLAEGSELCRKPGRVTVTLGNCSESDAPSGSGPSQVSAPEFDASAEGTDPRSFKRAFCTPIQVTFLGVWDTVGSVGALRRRELPWIEYNPSIRNFRQALALDENRGNFIPSLWDHSRTDVRSQQSANEVWFKGGHCDIGGGARAAESTFWDITALEDYDPSAVDSNSPKLFQPPRLSNIPLRWMIRQCLTVPEARILFDPTVMRIYRDSGILEKRPPGMKERELDELRKVLDDRDIDKEPFLAYNEGLKGWGWWVLDKLPVPKIAQTNKYTKPDTVKWPNNGAPRVVQFHGNLVKVNGTEKLVDKACVLLHTSVCEHLRDDEKAYAPAALWDHWLKDKWPQVAEGPSQLALLKVPESGKQRMNMAWNTKEAKGWFGGWLGW